MRNVTWQTWKKIREGLRSKIQGSGRLALRLSERSEGLSVIGGRPELPITEVKLSVQFK